MVHVVLVSMTDHSALTTVGHPAMLIASSSSQQSLSDFKALAKDPMYSVITGAREAYLAKYLAHTLGHKVTQSDDVRNLADLIERSAKEIERLWRTAACMSDAPVSTSYPYLPVMPIKPYAALSSGLSAGGNHVSGSLPGPTQNVVQNGIPNGLGGAAAGVPSSGSPITTKQESVIFPVALFPVLGLRYTSYNNFIYIQFEALIQYIRESAYLHSTLYIVRYACSHLFEIVNYPQESSAEKFGVPEIRHTSFT